MVTARNYADYFPYGISVAVRNLEYAADVNIGHPYVANLGAPLALSTTGIMVTAALTSGSASTFTAAAGQILNGGLVPHDSLTKRNGWGRGISVVASAASTRVITVGGYDYLGQRMSENMTANGTTPVNNLKAFQWIDTIVAGASADTVTLTFGWTNLFGLPYTFQHLIAEDKNYVVAANAGTFVAGLAEGTAATATNADVRGTYLPVTVIPDGVNIFEVTYMVRRGNLHGNAQFAG
jgi:hypothetical protein